MASSSKHWCAICALITAMQLKIFTLVCYIKLKFHKRLGYLWTTIIKLLGAWEKQGFAPKLILLKHFIRVHFFFSVGIHVCNWWHFLAQWEEKTLLWKIKLKPIPQFYTLFHNQRSKLVSKKKNSKIIEISVTIYNSAKFFSSL